MIRWANIKPLEPNLHEALGRGLGLELEVPLEELMRRIGRIVCKPGNLILLSEDDVALIGASFAFDYLRPALTRLEDMLSLVESVWIMSADGKYREVKL